MQDNTELLQEVNNQVQNPSLQTRAPGKVHPEFFHGSVIPAEGVWEQGNVPVGLAGSRGTTGDVVVALCSDQGTRVLPVGPAPPH